MFERFVCWDEASARQILRPLALEGNEAIFVATHSPISGLVIRGMEAHDVAEATERGLLDALSAPDRRHAMCVVEGEAGSGKSHLVRWLKVNWPAGDDLVVLIERADGTLDGTLRQLKDKLSAQAGASLEAIVPQRQLTERGQQEALLAQLASLSRSGVLVTPIGDEEWCAKHGVSEILQAPAVRSNWKAPGRLLEVLTKGETRDSRVARFTARDAVELADLTAGLKGKSVGPGAIRLGFKLSQEKQAVASALEGRSTQLDDPDLSTIAPESHKLLVALNGRLNLAVQSAMGISGAALQKMFRDLRRSLGKERRRLVILLEDITSAQGVDQELIYALQEKSATQEEYCDVVSVVGITPSYFRQHLQPQGNVLQRITHHIQFGEAEGTFQSVSALRHASEQVAFAARYLRAVRAGLKEVEAAHAEGREVANRCVTCEHRVECHAAFKEEAGVGLYPLTPKTIGRMFTSLQDPMGAMMLQTPRALIQAVLAPTFVATSALRDGKFPGPAVETDWHPEVKREVTGVAGQLTERQPEGIRERLRIAVAWWGDGAFPLEGDAPDAWAGVPGAVLRAFELPVLDAGFRLPMRQGPAAPLPTSDQEPEAGPEAGGGVPERPALTGPAQPAKPDRPRQSTRRGSSMAERLKQLRAWPKTGKIEDDGYWANLAKAFINELPWEHEDIGGWFAREGLGEVRLHGSGKTDQRNVVVPCASWAEQGLEWAALLQQPLADEEREVAIRAVSTFARRIRHVVQSWIESRMPSIEGGQPWSFIATAAQVALARAWLRGDTSPQAQLTDQWEAILSDDSSAGPARRPGASAWNDAVKKSSADWVLHKRLRDLVRLGDSEKTRGLADVSEAAGAIRSLASSASLAPFPASPPEQPTKGKWLTALVSSALVVKEALTALPNREVERLQGRAEQIVRIAGADDFAPYLQRAFAAITRFKRDLPTVSASEIAKWVELFEVRKALLAGTANPDVARLRGFLSAKSPNCIGEEATVPALLDYAIGTPAELVEDAYELLDRTSRVIQALVNYLAPQEKELTQLRDPGLVNAFGKRLADKADELAGRVS